MSLENFSPNDVGKSGLVADHQSRKMHNGFYPTEEQAAVFAALEESEDHLMLEARAGAGKTATILEATKRYETDPSDTLFLAFNKMIQTELKGKLPKGMWCKTLHAYGFGLIQREMDGKAEVDDKRTKSKDLIYQHYSKKLVKDVGLGPIRSLLDICKASLVDDDVDRVWNLAAAYGMDFEFEGHTPTIIPEIPSILEAMADDMTRVEFSDMTWMPVKNNIWVFPKGTVYVDEAQDLSPCNHEMVRRLISQGGRCIAVGDRFQALYGFRGADERSMGRMEQMLGRQGTRDVTRLPLTVTFRCPTNVVELAQRIVPDFKAFREEPGVIRHADPWDGIMEAERGDMVLCSKNAPLIQAAYRLIAERRPAMIRGRNVGRGLTSTIERVAGQKDREVNRDKPKDEFLEDLRTWRARKMKSLDEDDLEGRAKLQDRYECILIVARQSETAGEMLDFVDDVFGSVRDQRIDWNNLIQLSTVHKIKGGEADRVFILEPSEMGFGKQASNIIYVGITRAKEELVFLGNLPNALGGGRWGEEPQGGSPGPRGSGSVLGPPQGEVARETVDRELRQLEENARERSERASYEGGGW